MNTPHLFVVQPRRSWLRRLSRRFVAPKWQASMVILLASWVVLLILLAGLPSRWVEMRQSQVFGTEYKAAISQVTKVENAWLKPPNLPEFSQGDEPEIQQLLQEEPLLYGVVDPRNRQAWIRSGNRLTKDASEIGTRFQLWAQRASEEGSPAWHPPAGLQPEGQSESILLNPAGTRYVVKRWRPGAPEVDSFLLQALGVAGASPRMGILRPEEESAFIAKLRQRESAKSTSSISFATPLQLSTWSEVIYPMRSASGDSVFGRGWALYFLPRAFETEQKFSADNRRLSTLAWMAYGIIVVGTGSGLALWILSRRQELMERNQLATLAHSLKTPLAVLKLRCDSIRNRRLSPEKQDAYLEGIGCEVDELVATIENSLDSLRRTSLRTIDERIDRAFFDHLLIALEPAFRERGRELCFRFAAPTFRAHKGLLYSALQTLLENALKHGAGTSTLEVAATSHQVTIRVTDQGDGVNLEVWNRIAAALGNTHVDWRPKQIHRGNGFGLLLLAQFAIKEGWGITFTNGSPKGFEARLEVLI